MILATSTPENAKLLCGGPAFQVAFGSATYGSGHRKMVARHLLLPSINIDSADEVHAPPTDGGDDTVHEEQQQPQEEGSELIANKKKRRHYYKALTKVPATNEVLDPNVPGGYVARHHYTAAQCDILVSMNRGSSGLSYEQAIESCYGGQLNVLEDVIPIQRVRDKQEVERYFITPSVPRRVVAANVLQCLEPKVCDGKTSSQEDEICRDAAEITNSEEQKWKWRCLFAERETAKLREEQEKVEEVLVHLNNENKQLAEKNRSMSGLVEVYRERQHKEEVEEMKRKEEAEAAKVRRHKEEAEASEACEKQAETSKTSPLKRQESQGTRVEQSNPHTRKPYPPPAMPCYPPGLGFYPPFPGYFPVVPPVVPGIPPQQQQQAHNNPYCPPNQSNTFFGFPPTFLPQQQPPPTKTGNKVSSPPMQQNGAREEENSAQHNWPQAKNAMNNIQHKSPSKRPPPNSSQTIAVGERNNVEKSNCPPPQKKSKGEKLVWI